MSFSQNYFFSCHELSWTFRHGEWVNTPQNALQHDNSCVVNIGTKLKIALSGVRSIVRESLAKRLF